MVNYFELYDIPETLNPDVALVRKRWQELSRIYHPDKFANDTGGEQAEAMQRTALNNQAYKTLTNADATLAYILKLHGVLADEEKYALPADFLMEMMELNEAADAGELGVGNWELAETGWKEIFTPLAKRYNDGERSPELLMALKDAYFRKKYLLRLKERMP